jgi:hypothetical protein
MAQGRLISAKQIKIDKANSTIVSVLAVCSFVFVFSLVASKALISQYSYQNRVSSARQKTVNQLTTDKQAATSLIASYNSFVGQSTNIIGGSATGTANQDGSNSKIILDALPDTYDFPALVTSVQNLISGEGVVINSITGTDNSQGSSTSTGVITTTPSAAASSAASTSAIAMPFTFTVEGSYAAMQAVLANLQRSIRPIQIQSINMTGSDSDITMVVDAQTYYLPATGLDLTTETVK